MPACWWNPPWPLPPPGRRANFEPTQTLFEAAGRFKHSIAAKELFGTEFVEHFAATREWEEREYRKHVSDWELERYFEII